MNKKGFTLLELLVVVLIIGILAAVALPQYQKAVWKSRVSQLQVLANSLAQAQQVYFMTNGTYAQSFSELDLQFDNLTPFATSSLELLVPSTDAIRGNDSFELAINASESSTNNWVLSMAQFKEGPSRGGGFVFVHRYPSNPALEGKLHCFEKIDLGGKFCRKVMGYTMSPYTTLLSKYY